VSPTEGVVFYKKENLNRKHGNGLRPPGSLLRG